MIYILEQDELNNINGLVPRSTKMKHSVWIGHKIWLPTTDQLIKLCHELTMYKSEWRLLSQMKISLPKDYCTCYLKNLTIYN